MRCRLYRVDIFSVLQSVDASLVALLAGLSGVAGSASLRDRLVGAAEALRSQGWTGVQIVLFGRPILASAGIVASGEPSLALASEMLARSPRQFMEIVLSLASDPLHKDVVVLPLAIGGRELGCILLNAPDAEERPRAILRAWADVLAAILEADAEREEAQMTLRSLDSLLAFTRVGPLAEAISRLALDLVAADEAALYLATEDNYACAGASPNSLPSMQVGIGTVRRACEQSRSTRDFGGRMLIVPLQGGREGPEICSAALILARGAGAEPFDQEQVRRVEALAATCSPALRNVALYEEASEANQELSEINAFKDDLLAMFTHDFKGPLTVIAGYGELVLEKLVGDERENLSIILRQVKRLVTLADDALLLARAQATGFVLQTEPGELVAFLSEVVRSSFGTLANRIDFHPRVERIPLKFDQVALRHVFENILGNALKYSSGQVMVELDIEGEDAVVTVRDSGIGIPSQELPQVFGRFARASNARRRGVSGSGVGLYLAKRLVEQHGGSISVASVEGEGSTFTIHLPP
jgi:signal transduction histidine kinase